MEYVAGYVIANLIGTVASVAIGKKGKAYIESLKQETPGRLVAGVVAYIAVGSIVWLPTLPIRVFKSLKNGAINNLQTA